ncbi:Uncharacterised protein [Vibrio cholerae]|nr:Uncharacterised protein [Vibrio cholerae]CSD83058.1 Uncharacterised protein [Vibrio cholerae]
MLVHRRHQTQQGSLSPCLYRIALLFPPLASQARGLALKSRRGHVFYVAFALGAVFPK